MRIAARLVLGIILLLPWSGHAQEALEEGDLGPEEPWRRVLERNQTEGGLDYEALQLGRQDLDSFLQSLQAVDPDSLGDADRIAFWVNAYNAVVVHHVLKVYPELDSVKEVDGFFNELRYPVAGQELTLDEIENRARALGDPRVHFAVVCASTSCPDLRFEPYRGGELDAQLEESTRRFLADTSKGLNWNRGENTLELSSIFKWYAGDFTGGSTVVAFFARGKILDWLLPHMPVSLAEELENQDPAIRYMEYDWSLNDRRRVEEGAPRAGSKESAQAGIE